MIASIHGAADPHESRVTGKMTSGGLRTLATGMILAWFACAGALVPVLRGQSEAAQLESPTPATSNLVDDTWDHGSTDGELFIVYNEQRDTDVRTVPGLLNRSFIVKVNRLFRF